MHENNGQNSEANQSHILLWTKHKGEKKLKREKEEAEFRCMSQVRKNMGWTLSFKNVLDSLSL